MNNYINRLKRDTNFPEFEKFDLNKQQPLHGEEIQKGCPFDEPIFNTSKEVTYGEYMRSNPEIPDHNLHLPNTEKAVQKIDDEKLIEHEQANLWHRLVDTIQDGSFTIGQLMQSFFIIRK